MDDAPFDVVDITIEFSIAVPHGTGGVKSALEEVTRHFRVKDLAPAHTITAPKITGRGRD